MIRMKLKLSLELLLLLNGAGIVLSAATVTALLQVDKIVHASLYSYGLQFDYEWAAPYWAFFRLSLALLCGIAGVGLFSMLYVVASRKSLRDTRQIDAPLTPARAAQPARTDMEKEQVEPAEEKRDDGVEIVALPVECHECSRVSAQPLCMFDFKSGKPRVVNVCPYCNASLTASGNSRIRQ